MIPTMILMLDGDLEVGVHVKSYICVLICLRPFIRLRAVRNRSIFSKIKHFLCSCAKPYYIKTMDTLWHHVALWTLQKNKCLEFFVQFPTGWFVTLVSSSRLLKRGTYIRRYLRLWSLLWRKNPICDCSWSDQMTYTDQMTAIAP